MWGSFAANGPTDTAVPQLQRWHRLAREKGIDMLRLGAAPQIRAWWEETEEDHVTWGLLFQMVWADSTAELLGELANAGFSWLSRGPESGAWNFVWQLLWSHRPGRTRPCHSAS